MSRSHAGIWGVGTSHPGDVSNRVREMWNPTQSERRFKVENY